MGTNSAKLDPTTEAKALRLNFLFERHLANKKIGATKNICNKYTILAIHPSKATPIQPSLTQAQLKKVAHVDNRKIRTEIAKRQYNHGNANFF